MQPAQRRAGLDAEFVDQAPVSLLVVGERVADPPAPVLGEHQLAGQAFVERMHPAAGEEFGDQRCVLPASQPQIGAVQLRGEML